MVSTLVNRFGLRRLLLSGIASMVLGLALITGAMVHTNLPVLLLGMVFTGIGQGAAFGPITSVGIWQTKPQEAGAASGLVNTGHQMGATMGVAGLTGLLNSNPHYSIALLASTLLMLAVLIIMGFVGRQLKESL